MWMLVHQVSSLAARVDCPEMARETLGIQIVTIQHPSVHGFQCLRNRPCESIQPGNGSVSRQEDIPPV